MPEKRMSPKAHAIALSKAWGNRFPVDVRQIAMELSSMRPDRIKMIQPVTVPVDAFEGALLGRVGGKRWAILYSQAIREKGKINFTIAHELGHYELHRHEVGATLCSEDDLRDFALATHAALGIEQEANTFASYLLMPIGDFRQQAAGQAINVELLEHCASRYEASLSACALKLIEFTERPVIAALSRAGVVLWARSSEAAFKRGWFLRKGDRLPLGCLSADCQTQGVAANVEAGAQTDAWFGAETFRESAIAQPFYGTVFTLLEGAAGGASRTSCDEEPIEDALDRFRAFSRDS